MTRQRRHPDWLKVRLPSGETYNRINRILESRGLNTVCRHARCPNTGECFGNGTATFLILGHNCTRNCRYCAVTQSRPEMIDPMEPEKVADTVRDLKLKHVVITSVTRDDLPDGGARHFAETAAAVRRKNPGTTIEFLIPDLKGDSDALMIVLDSRPDVLGHNIETVRELFPEVRPLGDYNRSLTLLKTVCKKAPEIKLKSGLMLGLGENDGQIENSLKDLRACGVSIVTLGQYLTPAKGLHPVSKYYTPEEFLRWKETALGMGFDYAESGPLVRSSYHAEKALK